MYRNDLILPDSRSRLVLSLARVLRIQNELAPSVLVPIKSCTAAGAGNAAAAAAAAAMPTIDLICSLDGKLFRPKDTLVFVLWSEESVKAGAVKLWARFVHTRVGQTSRPLVLHQRQIIIW